MIPVLLIVVTVPACVILSILLQTYNIFVLHFSVEQEKLCVQPSQQVYRSELSKIYASSPNQICSFIWNSSKCQLPAIQPYNFPISDGTPDSYILFVLTLKRSEEYPEASSSICN
ncbi:Hypothetical_protein [Hexamita inflata]|uniref:Hypothetical_protein n=1 Tax=Hexamita inflata TaxID=28002 RepID=A0AA86QU16_9EUKA|nr:Hypothetical protein HINF_LOCUS53689 [Hexamita inflata]